jgi:septum site-determining protein MinD
MSRVISVHSFRGGTGKSNAAANVATLLAAEGQRVGVVDTDIQSPGIHTLFGLNQDAMRYSLNQYLWGTCDITQDWPGAYIWCPPASGRTTSLA